MCERQSTTDIIRSYWVQEPERPLYILHSGFFQFEHGIICVPGGGPRVPGLFRIEINVVGAHASELFW